MSQEKTAQTLPRVNIGTIGHVDGGKTTLAAAITKVLAKSGGATIMAYSQLDKASKDAAQGTTPSAPRVEYKTKKRHYTHVDCPEQAAHVKNMLTGAVKMNGVILVVSALDGIKAQTREHLQLASQAGVSHIVVFLNKVDVVDDPEMSDILEGEVRDLLNEHKFPGDTIPIVSGSALRALQGESSDMGEPSILKLLEAMDKYIPEPKQP